MYVCHDMSLAFFWLSTRMQSIQFPYRCWYPNAVPMPMQRFMKDGVIREKMCHIMILYHKGFAATALFLYGNVSKVY